MRPSRTVKPNEFGLYNVIGLHAESTKEADLTSGSTQQDRSDLVAPGRLTTRAYSAGAATTASERLHWNRSVSSFVFEGSRIAGAAAVRFIIIEAIHWRLGNAPRPF